jgi:hypothetical protein
MPDLEFLEKYSGQSLDELISMEERYRVDSLVLAMESALDVKAGRTALTPEERVILAVEALEREVNNGGYDQFFLNSSREYAGEIEAALRSIGCPQQADIARRAVALLGIDGVITNKAIEEAQAAGGEELTESLNELDNEYYGCDEPIADSLLAFVKQNRSRIRIP